MRGYADCNGLGGPRKRTSGDLHSSLTDLPLLGDKDRGYGIFGGKGRILPVRAVKTQGPKAGRAPLWLLVAMLGALVVGVSLLLYSGGEGDPPLEDPAVAEPGPAEEPTAPEPEPEPAPPGGEPGAEEPPQASLLFPTVPLVTREGATPALPFPPPGTIPEPTPADPQVGPVVLAGRAYDRDTEEGVPEVCIRMTIFGGEGSRFFLGTSPIEVTTDSEGRFHKEVPVQAPVSRNARVSVMFEIECPGGGFVYTGPASLLPGGMRMTRVALQEGELRLDLPFRAGSPLAGRVLEPDASTPASGVTVHASTSAGSEHSYQAETETDEEGRFEIRLPPNSIGHLRAEGPEGVARSGFRMPGEGGHPEMVLVLTKFGTVEGRVVDPAGEDVSGAAVTAVSETAPGGSISRTTESDEDGYFVIERVPEGHVEVTAAPPEDSRAFESEPMSLALEAAETKSGLLLELQEGDELPVRVISAYTENPVQGASLRVEIAGMPARDVQTDESGRHTIKGIPPGGRVSLIGVNHPEFDYSFRQDVSPLDGEQVFRLSPLHNRELVVRWAEDRSPVTHFSYIMLRKGWNQFDIDVQRGNQVVESDDGRTMITGLSEGEWRVEAVHLTESGEPTAVRGATEFEVAGSPDGAEPVEVLLTDQLSIEGVVRQADTWQPVANALVEVVPPAQHDPVHFWSQPQAAERHIDPVYTDSSGHFEITGLTAGDHTLSVRRGAYRNRRPVDVRVYAGDEPEFVEIDIERGAALHGQVIDRHGDSVAGARLTHSAPNFNYTEWKRTEYTANADGNFRIEGLLGGPHTLILEDDREGIDGDRRGVTVDFGEQKRVDFDFYNLITVYGEVEMPGREPPATGLLSLVFNPAEGGNTATASVVPETMEYEVRLRPGRYSVTAQAPGRDIRGEGQRITVDESPPEQRRDVKIDYTEADIVLVFPTEQDFQPGLAMIAPEERHRRYGFIRVRMDQEARRTVHLMGGNYRVTFTSEDGRWRGESGSVEIGSDSDNIFILEMRRVLRNIRIGTWDPGTISLQTQPQLYDVSRFIRSAGTVEVLVEYDRGRNATVAEWAHLYKDGEIISTDRHEGWTGFEHWNNVYRLNLEDYDPSAVYHIEVGLRADGGVDSFGSVYLSMN